MSRWGARFACVPSPWAPFGVVWLQCRFLKVHSLSDYHVTHAMKYPGPIVSVGLSVGYLLPPASASVLSLPSPLPSGCLLVIQASIAEWREGRERGEGEGSSRSDCGVWAVKI